VGAPRHRRRLAKWPLVGGATLVLVVALATSHRMIGHSAAAVPRPSTGTVTAAGPPAGLPAGLAGQDWRLAFDDEFAGPALDPARWAVCYPWGDCNNAGNVELEWYQAANCTVAGGQLDLVVRAAPVGSRQPYTSCLVQTAGSFSFTYGYAEARVWLPAGAGLWPAFWLAPANGHYPPEIDVMEADGAFPNQAAGTYHPVNPREPQVSVPLSGPFTSGWHVFGVDWEPGHLTWYVDGQPVGHVSGPAIAAQPMYLIVDLAVSGRTDWHSAPGPGTALPATMAVDEVRVYQRAG
jgi:beta-glucanase (GH16 family)